MDNSNKQLTRDIPKTDAPKLPFVNKKDTRPFKEDQGGLFVLSSTELLPVHGRVQHVQETPAAFQGRSWAKKPRPPRLLSPYQSVQVENFNAVLAKSPLPHRFKLV